MQNDSQTGKPERKPWPMWPIAVSILTFIVLYTWVQLAFRKEEKPYEPSHRMQQRQRDIAEKNMYDWYSLTAESRTEESAAQLSSDTVKIRFIDGPLENELPAQIVYYIPRRPLLVPEIQSLSVPNEIRSEEHISIRFQMPAAYGDHPDFNITSFYKEGLMIILAEMQIESERELAAIPRDGSLKNYEYAIDSGPIETDRIEVRLFTEGQVREWSAAIARTE